MDLRRLAAALISLPSAAYSLLRSPAPAGHLRTGKMTSSAWEGWWHEDHPAD